MITITHVIHGGWYVDAIPLDETWLTTCLYLSGETKPRYPMPAIALECYINDDSVMTIKRARSDAPAPWRVVYEYPAQ